ncbi:hypothetical protein [Cysteiniphilum sp. QT6929]|uniref:hypothetical protein n=1 Tax=Cysteiniphilum sp. QT6929 TaxID=2975055 RepID=UPI0024B33E9B|nr:hypothetical protein [Cysteiniphilum sp. QT6929]WHN66754.1 hypothetical protein NYP54_11765 [Cysteiniphilum sp. QT6929]
MKEILSAMMTPTTVDQKLSQKLKNLKPHERIRLLRREIVKQNQTDFCNEGIVRIGTLKLIESARVKVGKRVANGLAKKFELEGIYLDPSMFMEKENSCVIKVNKTHKSLCNDPARVEVLRKNLSSLTPITINVDIYNPFLPKNTMIMGSLIHTEQEIKSLDNTLCLIQGNAQNIYYMSYRNGKLRATFNNEETDFPMDIAKLCQLYRIDVVFYK